MIDYSSSSGIKLFQEANQSIPIKFNITVGWVNQFIKALKDKAQKMVWDAHTTSQILTIKYGNVNNLNLFDNYGQLSRIYIESHTAIKL